MVGAGALAPFLVRAHASVRPIREVAIWNRSPPRAQALIAALAQARHCRHPRRRSARRPSAAADIVSTATLSAEPLVRGAWLKPGTHLDCVGAFKPTMRETDDEVARRARIFVDTRAGAFAEAGDILQPLQAGVIGKEAVLGELVRAVPRHRAGTHVGRGDHALQVGRRVDRGPGRGGGGVRALGVRPCGSDPVQPAPSDHDAFKPVRLEPRPRDPSSC